MLLFLSWDDVGSAVMYATACIAYLSVIQVLLRRGFYHELMTDAVRSVKRVRVESWRWRVLFAIFGLWVGTWALLSAIFEWCKDCPG